MRKGWRLGLLDCRLFRKVSIALLPRSTADVLIRPLGPYEETGFVPVPCGAQPYFKKSKEQSRRSDYRQYSQ